MLQVQNSGHVKKFGKHILACHPAGINLPPADRQALLHRSRLQWIPGSGIRILSPRSHCRGRFSTCTKPQPLELPAWGKLPGALQITRAALSGAPRYHPPPMTDAPPPGASSVLSLRTRSPARTSRRGPARPCLRCQQVTDGRCEALGTALLAPLAPAVTAS